MLMPISRTHRWAIGAALCTTHGRAVAARGHALVESELALLAALALVELALTLLRRRLVPAGARDARQGAGPLMRVATRLAATALGRVARALLAVEELLAAARRGHADARRAAALRVQGGEGRRRRRRQYGGRGGRHGLARRGHGARRRGRGR